MASTIRKTRVEDDSEDALIRECKEETDCGDCEAPDWIKPDGTRTNPPNDTVAIVVDMRNNVGAVLIHERRDGKYKGGVGTEDQGYMVMVPWSNDWYYYSIGSTRLAYIKKK
ncbi:hypothetical protein AOQ84DRAFT_131021 [Glonium stellatum]|uniref:Uncharacterized protein n=1 Tax=Glonium stellatum TaxID=574774 RepID=A0A8E2F9B4_9PEZI|nr:hypothetical protein AOQ84DRAFT_131021 [Glonium stellatum]